MSYVVFDLETLHSTDEEGFSFGRPWQLGLAVACTWSEEDGARDWFAPDAWSLLQYLGQQERVVSFNGLRFDYRVLDGAIAPGTGEVSGGDVAEMTRAALRGKSIDMLLDVVDALGKRIKLARLAEGTLGEFKEMPGELAPKEWAAGRRLEVIRYCRHDVEITRKLYEWGVEGAPLLFSADGDREAGEVRPTWTLR